MSETTEISWADSTWNPWRGCTKVSPGCLHCYAEDLVTKRMGGVWGKGAPRVRSKTTFNDPLKWNKKPRVCDHCGTAQQSAASMGEGCIEDQCPSYLSEHVTGLFHRRRVFSLSLGDWLDPEVPVEWLAEMLDIIRRCDGLDFLLLTKRPELWNRRIQEVLASNGSENAGDGPYPKEAMDFEQWLVDWLNEEPPPHVWIGTSVEDQKRADERIPELLKIPAMVRFLSVEPLLGSVEFSNVTGRSDAVKQLGRKTLAGIHWVIVGGESGPNRRDCGVDAIVSAAIQCQAAGVPPFVKQDSAAKPGQQGRIPNDIWNLKQFPAAKW